MKHEISLDTLILAKRALEELTQWHLERAIKDLMDFNLTADMRKRAYKAASQIDMATYAFLSTKKLEVTNDSLHI